MSLAIFLWVQILSSCSFFFIMRITIDSHRSSHSVNNNFEDFDFCSMVTIHLYLAHVWLHLFRGAPMMVQLRWHVLSPLALSSPRPPSSTSTLRPSTPLVPSLLALAPVCPGNINQLTTHLEFSCLVSRDTRPRLPPLVPLLVVPDQEKQLMIVTTAVNKILLRIL